METQTDQITPQELLQLQSENKPFYLLDVRTFSEREQFNIGGQFIPLNELPARCNELPKDAMIVVYCRSGQRSQAAVDFLKEQGFKDTKNLSGGVLALNSMSTP